MIRVGMIGCGKFAATHCQAYSTLKDKMRLSAFADIDIKAAEKAAAAAMQPAKVTADFRDILPDVDAVVLTLPHDQHHPVGMECLKAGKHVLLEKPLAITEQQCLELIAMDNSPDPVLMLGYVQRHHPLWKRFGQYIEQKTFGDVFHVSIWTEQYTYRSPDSWSARPERAGGGQLFNHGCHYIDLLLHWLGRPVCGAHVGTNFGTPWMQMEGTSNVSLKFENGATAYHFGTWGARGSRLRYSAHAHCTEGMLELRQLDGTITLHRSHSDGDLPALEALAVEDANPEEPEQVVIYRTDERDKALARQMEAFLDCIENKKKPEISAASSLPSLRVIWKLYEAEQSGVVADLTGATNTGA